MADRAQRDERRAVRAVLRGGLVVGCLLMAIGLVLALAQGRLLAHAVTLRALPHLIATGRPSAFMALGLLVLLLTPIVRVVVLIVGFAREGDVRFTLVAITVALLLVAGVLLGRA